MDYGKYLRYRNNELSLTILNYEIIIKITNKNMTKNIKPIHPGEILMEEFLKPLEISQYRLAKDIGVAPLRNNEIVREIRTVTADTALRLGKYFSVSPQFWLNLQSHYNLEMETKTLSAVLKHDVKILKYSK